VEYDDNEEEEEEEEEGEGDELAGAGRLAGRDDDGVGLGDGLAGALGEDGVLESVSGDESEIKT